MNPLAARRRRREAAARSAAEFFAQRRYLREDVTSLGEQLGDLDADTRTVRLDEEAQSYYRHALESYETAKKALDAAEETTGLGDVQTALVHGRHRIAAVRALIAGEPVPARLSECFFNPQHGPSHTEIAWTPPGGVERRVAVCAGDARRLGQGEQPLMRMVRIGDRYVALAHLRGDESSDLPLGGVDLEAVNRGIADAYVQSGRHGFLPNNQAASAVNGMAL